MPASRNLLALGAVAAFATLTACASGSGRMDAAAAPSSAASAESSADDRSTTSTTAASGASAVSSSAASNAAATRSTSRNRSLLTTVDIEGASAQTMSEVVQRLRPQWLQATGTRSLGGGASNQRVSVYVDGQRYGDVNQLKNITPSMVREARFYNASEAQSRFGLRDAGPVIAITTRK